MRDKLTIIPAVGTATRMGNLPKFLLPIGNQSLSVQMDTLLGQHIEYGLHFADLVVIPTRPENAFLLKPYVVPGKVEVLIMETNTMAETILRVSKIVNSLENLILMPDTYFSERISPSHMELRNLELLTLALWPITPNQIGQVGQIAIEFDHNNEPYVCSHSDKNPECNFPYLWGAMNISFTAMELLDESMPHCGYLITELLKAKNSHHTIGARIQNGNYFDCGTPSGYFSHLSR